MSKETYRVYAIADNGNGRVMELGDWDGIDTLELVVGMFAKDTVIEIEPKRDGNE